MNPLGRRVPPDVLEQHGDRQHRGGGVGLPLAGDIGGRPVHRLEHRRVDMRYVEVAAGGETDTAGDCGGKVGNDVAEKIVRDDDVVASRVSDHVDGRCVDVVVGHG